MKVTIFGKEVEVKAGIYDNIVDFFEKHGLLDDANDEVSDPQGRTIDMYLDDYCDRDISSSFMYDYGNGFKWKSHTVMFTDEPGIYDWRNSKFEVFE